MESNADDEKVFATLEVLSSLNYKADSPAVDSFKESLKYID